MNNNELISTTFSKDTILIGDQVEWGARFKVPSDVTVWVDTLLNPVVPGVELIRGYKFDTLSSKKGELDIDMKAIITSFDSGSYYLPRQVIYLYKDDILLDTLVVNEKTLEVTTVPIDTATYQMYDIKPVVEYPVKAKEVLPWVGLGLLLLTLGFFLFKVIKNWRKGSIMGGHAAPSDPPHITALRTLERIRCEKLWQNNKEKQFYTEVTDAIRLYIDGRYHIPTLERTSQEIFESLEALDQVELPSGEFAELKELFEVADLVKFAKYKASEGENERAIPVAVRFVNATFVQDLEKDKEVTNG